MKETITALEKVYATMSHSDGNFYRSLASWFQKRGSLSPAQEFHLERLSKKYCVTEEEALKRQKWLDNYSQEHRLIALRCAKYYHAQHHKYYGSIVDRVLLAPQSHKLCRDEFNKLCNNKYAKKIRAAYDAPVKFSPGDLVQIRATNRLDIANERFYEFISMNTRALRNKFCMILEVDALPITRPAKGARVYKVLVTGVSRTFYAHESDLKTVRGTKK